MKNETAVRGQIGESTVCTYLEKHGYTVVSRNYRTRRGEIDIIAARDGVVHFVEVKARSGADFGTPAEAVDRAKRRRIVAAAKAYAAGNGLFDTVILFDVAEVRLTPQGETVKYLENAFDMSDI